MFLQKLEVEFFLEDPCTCKNSGMKSALVCAEEGTVASELALHRQGSQTLHYTSVSIRRIYDLVRGMIVFITTHLCSYAMLCL